jgi:protein transport protein SEC20
MIKYIHFPPLIADSSKTIQSTYGEYQNFGSLMHISKRLVTQLENSDWFDRILLLCGMMLFCLVVLYIIKKRTWDVGISWVSWITQTKKNKKILEATTTIIQQTVAPITIATATSTSSSVETTSSVIESAASVIESVVTTTAQTILPSVVTVIKDEL